MAWSNTYLSITWSKYQQSEPKKLTSETSYNETHNFCGSRIAQQNRSMVCGFQRGVAEY
jgi:hypothetical protein